MRWERTVRATGWSAVDVLIRHGAQFAFTLVLARLLTPLEFGTIALLALFTGVALTVVDGGFSTAIIQRRALSHDDESTIFWLNLAVGLMMAAVLALASPAIAALYNVPILLDLSLLFAVVIVLSAFSTVPVALIIRDLQFRTMVAATATATISSGALAVALAARGAGVWALAAQSLAYTACMTAMVWALTGWRPRRVFRRDSAKELFATGGYVLAANLSDVIFTRAYSLVVGKFFGVRAVGLYSQADNAQQMPVSLLSTVFARVALPVFSEAQDDQVRLRGGVRAFIRTLMFINVPIMLALAVLADPLIVLLLGDQWASAAPIFAVLCLAGVMWPLHVINLQALVAQGHARLFFRLEIAKKVIGVPLLLGGAAFGLLGVAWAQVLFGAFAFVINAHYTQRFLGYGARGQLADIAPTLALSAPLGFAGYLLVSQSILPDVWLIAGVVVVGGGAYLGLAHVAGLTAMTDLVSLARQTWLRGSEEVGD